MSVWTPHELEKSVTKKYHFLKLCHEGQLGNCPHIWSTISNLSWAPEAQSERLRKSPNLPTQTEPWPKDPILSTSDLKPALAYSTKNFCQFCWVKWITDFALFSYTHGITNINISTIVKIKFSTSINKTSTNIKNAAASMNTCTTSVRNQGIFWHQRGGSENIVSVHFNCSRVLSCSYGHVESLTDKPVAWYKRIQYITDDDILATF